MRRRDLIFSMAALSAFRGGPVSSAGLPAATEFRAMQISSGVNRPGLRLESDKLLDVLVALHRRHPESAIATGLNLTSDQLQDRLQRLVAEGLVKRRPDGRFVPTVTQTVSLIEARVPSLQAACRSLPGFRNVSFADASLLLLSDVLLDDCQIDEIEAEFLHAPRTLRGGGRYYLAVVENEKSTPVEPLGFYGNHQEQVGPIAINLYGNQRYKGPENLITLTQSDAVSAFGFEPTTPLPTVRRELANDIFKLWGDPKADVSEPKKAGLRGLGLVDDNGKVLAPVLSASDNDHLSEIATAFRPALLQLLEARRASIQAAYKASPYFEDVSFEEYAIWWYHAFYSAVTDQLIVRGTVTPPKRATLTYFTLT
jgi:hypothetical protein